MATTAPEVMALTCWKDIASYLGKGVRTVQRWEQEFGLPVRRPNGVSHKSPVAADPRDLDVWLKSRWSVRTEREETDLTHPESNLNFRKVQVRIGMLEQLRKNVKLSAELRAQLRTSQEEHRALVHQVATNMICMGQTWQVQMSTPPAKEESLNTPFPTSYSE